MLDQAEGGRVEMMRALEKTTKATAGKNPQRLLVLAFVLIQVIGAANAADLMAGVARIDITDYDAGPVNDPLYAKALVIKNDAAAIAIVTVDAVAIGEIGPIGNSFLGEVRETLHREHGIEPANVLVNASHCHGVVRSDSSELTASAVGRALENLVPVTVGVGSGREDRIMENRRFTLANGDQADSRRAYALPPDRAFAEVGPIDPEIGVLRLDRRDGTPLAALYNFACHPIQGVPGGGNTADMIGFASTVIEENLGGGAIALFLQGCAGDINPAHYKDADHPHDAEPLGNLLGLSTLRALRSVQTGQDSRLTVINETVELPRADFTQRIKNLEAKREELVESLRGTPINLKTFIPLAVKYGLSPEYPSTYAHRYLHEEAMGWDHATKLDVENRSAIQRYMDNAQVMEELTRLQANLRLLRKHQADNAAAPKSTIDVEVMALRIGGFVLATFPGEPTVRIGLNIKQASPHEHTFVAGYTNGYIYYAGTAEQLHNTGYAQEDSDCILAPEWQAIYESKVAELLSRL